MSDFIHIVSGDRAYVIERTGMALMAFHASHESRSIAVMHEFITKYISEDDGIYSDIILRESIRFLKERAVKWVVVYPVEDIYKEFFLRLGFTQTNNGGLIYEI